MINNNLRDQGDFIDEDDTQAYTNGHQSLDFTYSGHPLYSTLHGSCEVSAYTITLNSKYHHHTLSEQYLILRSHIAYTLGAMPYYFVFELTKAKHPHAHGVIICDDTQLRCNFTNGLIKIGHVNVKKCYSKYGWFVYMHKNYNSEMPAITNM